MVTLYPPSVGLNSAKTCAFKSFSLCETCYSNDSKTSFSSYCKKVKVFDKETMMNLSCIVRVMAKRYYCSQYYLLYNQVVIK